MDEEPKRPFKRPAVDLDAMAERIEGKKKEPQRSAVDQWKEFLTQKMSSGPERFDPAHCDNKGNLVEPEQELRNWLTTAMTTYTTASSEQKERILADTPKLIKRALEVFPEYNMSREKVETVLRGETQKHQDFLNAINQTLDEESER